MLDIRLIREHPEQVQRAMARRGIDVDMKALIQTDQRYREVLQETEEIRARHNSMSEEIASLKGKEREEKILEGKEVKQELARKEEMLEELQGHVRALLVALPNMPQEHVPSGGAEHNRVLGTHGTIPKFSFPLKDHVEIGESLGILDMERAAKVSGSRFAYSKGKGALLELALVQFVMEQATGKGFTPVLPPALVKAETMQKMGYVDTPEDTAERYLLDRQGLFLVGTAEQSVGPMHQDEIFEENDLPRRYVAFSPCFREEAGSYGKDTRGIIRLHQFYKVELFSYAHPDASEKEHAFLVDFEKQLWDALQIPYRVVQLAAGDMSRPASSCIDIEAWLPGQNQYREVSSASNTTDFQARRLRIRFRKKDGHTEFVHMLNATGLPMGRTMVAILENYQQEDGSVRIPEALQKYLPFKDIQPS